MIWTSFHISRGKSLLESWVTTFLPDCLIYLKLLLHGKCSCDFEVNPKKIQGGCQSGRKVVPHHSKSDLPLMKYFV